MSRNLPLPYLLHPGLVLAAVLAVGCTPSATPPATDPSTQQPTFGAGDMPPGTHVQVARQGQWYAATIVQPLGEGRFVVHYDNTGNEWNEAVGLDRIKPLGAPAGAGPARDYRPGEKVLVTYQNRLLLADVVMQLAPDTWRIHYSGFGAEAGESVGPDRIRRPYAGPTGHAPGEGVQVDVHGKTLGAKILVATAPDRWLVRFDKFGPEYDQEVGVDRIRAASTIAAPPPPPQPEAKVDKPAEPPAAKPAEKPKPKAAERAKPRVAEGAPSVPAGPPAVGEEVLVNARGAWFAATVTAAGAGTVKVKFHAGGEEQVAADRILRDPGSLRGLHFQPGQLVVVDYKGIFVPGKVIKQQGKSDYKIRFDGQGPAEDEVIAARRLRPR